MAIDLSIVNQLIIMAILVETITEIIKGYDNNVFTPQVKQVIALGVGMAMAIIFKVSVFGDSNTGALVLGIIFSGLIVSRGSNITHDTIKILTNLGNMLKDKTTETE